MLFSIFADQRLYTARNIYTIYNMYIAMLYLRTYNTYISQFDLLPKKTISNLRNHHKCQHNTYIAAFFLLWITFPVYVKEASLVGIRWNLAKQWSLLHLTD